MFAQYTYTIYSLHVSHYVNYPHPKLFLNIYAIWTLTSPQCFLNIYIIWMCKHNNIPWPKEITVL
jgi:hypothetical protein